MKKSAKMLFTSLAIGLFSIVMPASAQTHDGETPTDEGVCDALRADGVTEGLYGLCVAFCEAQDWTSEDAPISPEELAQLEGAAPSNKILGNYNERKNASDPDMPCIRVQEPCPCWTEEEFTSITSNAVTFPSCVFQNVPEQTYVWSQQLKPNNYWVNVDTRNGGQCATSRGGYVNPQTYSVTPTQYGACKQRILTFQESNVGVCPFIQ